MKDQAEFRCGATLARRVVQDLHNTEPHDITLSLQKAFESNPLLGIGEKVFFHAVCFCRERDVASQWQGFSGSGGCAIGLDFPKVLSRARTAGFAIAKVIYEEPEQTEIVRRVVRNGVEVFNKYGKLRQSQSCASSFVFAIGRILLNWICRFKLPCFAPEDEWRLLVPIPVNETKSRVFFRDSGNSVMPYCKVPIRNDWVTHVIRSPGAWPPNDAYGIERLARLFGDQVRIEISPSA
jgi:hypothetical protein